MAALLADEEVPGPVERNAGQALEEDGYGGQSVDRQR
jgi:hypothetical protein